MWPFKPEISFEDRIKDKPEPACGKKTEHYEWKLERGLQCPRCWARKQAEKEDAERELLAQRIAYHLHELMK